MDGKIWVAGLGAVCAVSACGSDDESAGPGGGAGGVGATSGAGGGGGSTGGSAGSTGGNAGAGNAGGATDAGSDGEACAGDALDCTGIGATSSYDGGTKIVTVVIGSNVTPVVSGSAAIQLDCSSSTVSAPVTPNSTGFTIDLSASAPPGDVTPCKPVRFTGKDSCGRNFDFEVQLTYTAESGVLILTCPTLTDASTE